MKATNPKNTHSPELCAAYLRLTDLEKEVAKILRPEDHEAFYTAEIAKQRAHMAELLVQHAPNGFADCPIFEPIKAATRAGDVRAVAYEDDTRRAVRLKLVDGTGKATCTKIEPFTERYREKGFMAKRFLYLEEIKRTHQPPEPAPPPPPRAVHLGIKQMVEVINRVTDNTLIRYNEDFARLRAAHDRKLEDWDKEVRGSYAATFEALAARTLKLEESAAAVAALRDQVRALTDLVQNLHGRVVRIEKIEAAVKTLPA